ncbi:MAG: pyridoxamine 5'-phosphate oxidase [Nitrospina sp.]|mgnify:CR=1|jgi:hypothetical protein|nr:pyridoxamine 5'-phosphate oxidase [Nitrospina sp.]MBT6716522.1 pyridoxamine 5'-phosphate oxidase [Nitrospina sp.]
MKTPVSDIAFTAEVKKQQQRFGSRGMYERVEQSNGWQSKITDDLKNFIAEMDSFYLATTNSDGQPYIQHRGGAKGFLKPLDENRLAFADFSGNRQYITLGNLQENQKAFIFLMDYKTRRRIKIWGTAKAVENDSKLLDQVLDKDYKARPERVMVFQVEAWDVNCPQHIQQRFTEEDIQSRLETYKTQLEEQIEENRSLRQKIEKMKVSFE